MTQPHYAVDAEWRRATADKHERRFGRKGFGDWLSVACVAWCSVIAAVEAVVGVVTGRPSYLAISLVTAVVAAASWWSVWLNARRRTRAKAFAADLRRGL